MQLLFETFNYNKLMLLNKKYIYLFIIVVFKIFLQ